MLSSFNIQDFLSAFIVLFAILDLPGALPVIINIQKKGQRINPLWAALSSFLLLIGFFYVGEAFLNLFGLDISSFAIAGSIVIFLIGLEMTLDIDLFKENAQSQNDATFVPVVFPLLVGAGVLTTLLSIRAQYATVNIITALLANVVCIYLTLKMLPKIDKILGPGIIYILKKFFGIILLSIAMKLFVTNVTLLIGQIQNTTP